MSVAKPGRTLKLHAPQTDESSAVVIVNLMAPEMLSVGGKRAEATATPIALPHGGEIPGHF